jgi:hypothetical protein
MPERPLDLHQCGNEYCGHYGEMLDGKCIRCIAVERDCYRQAMERAEELRDRYRDALRYTVAPLEVMHALGHDWQHPRLAVWWRRLVSRDLRRQIRDGVYAAREAVK